MRKIIKISSLSLLIGLLSSFQKKQDRPVTIFMIGDSTMASKAPEKAPETGWGQVFGLFFNDKVTIVNKAQNGRSSKSFIGEGLWNEVLEKLQPGDYVFIQFGHNDQKINSPERYTNPYSTYRANLERFVNETRAKGATPVLLSSIVRRKFNENGTLEDTHGAYPFVARMVAREMNVSFVDLQLMTENLVNEMGPKESEKLYLILQPGESPNYKDGVTDNTHLCTFGATKYASMVIEELKKQNHPLKNYLK